MIQKNSDWPRFFSFELNTSLNCDVRGPRIVSELSPSCSPIGPISINVSGSRWDSTIRNLNGVLIVSTQLSDELKSENLAIGTSFLVVINKIRDGAILNKEPKNYDYFRCRRAIEFDRSYYEFPAEVSKCLGVAYRKVPLFESWLGEDVFGSLGTEWSTLICSRRFVEIAFEQKWEHFYFMALDLPYGLGRPECRINPGKHKHPPQWYPDGFTPHPNNLGPMPEPDGGHLPKVPEIGTVLSSKLPTLAAPAQAWTRPIDENAGEPTGHELMGEPVRWFTYDEGLDPADAEFVKALMAPHLEAAVKAAETYLLGENKSAEEEEPPEVWGVEVTVSSQTPDDGSDFLWAMHISVSNAGPCPAHFLTFRGSELIDVTAAD